MPNCYKCKLELEESCFAKNSTLKSGIQNICKECSRKLNQEYYKKNKEKFLDRNKQKRIETKQKVDEIKKSGCKVCGENFIECLDFHHTEQKTDDISTMLRNNVCFETIMKEIEKCILLCANCHRKVHKGSITL